MYQHFYVEHPAQVPESGVVADVALRVAAVPEFDYQARPVVPGSLLLVIWGGLRRRCYKNFAQTLSPFSPKQK